MSMREGKDNDSKEGQISIAMNEGIDQIVKASMLACSGKTEALRVTLSAICNTIHCTAMGISPHGATKPTDEAICVAAMMGYYASPSAEEGGFTMEVSPERWLDALAAAEKLLGRPPDSGLNTNFVTAFREYQNKAAGALTDFLGRAKPGQNKSLN